MNARQQAPLPRVLSITRRQFDHWRSRHRKHTRPPEELRRQAAALAREHGLNKTARALGLEYYSLKKHLDEMPAEQLIPAKAKPGFIELVPAPKMAEFKSWLADQIEQHKVEPNSGLGEAISYMLKHWEALTLFLREPGAPLDSNVCERALKKAILHRKNTYFYKTRNGARVGDLFMSLIHTCELNRVNPFAYLTQLQEHANEPSSDPDSWMPWNYQNMLQTTDAP